jgi:calcineurin-like phosphoesterase family protein
MRGVSAVWFSSDTHFLHAMVAGKRGFASSAEHDEAVTERWNRLVRPGDLVWHLGDVGLGNETRVLEQAARLNGRKQLVTGNHDPCWPGHRDSRKHQRRWLEVFESVQPFAKIRLDGRHALLSHFPYEGDHTGEDRATQYRLRDEGAWLIHGHTHLTNRLGPNPRYLTIMDPATGGPGASRRLGREVHAGLDAWDLQPASEADIIGVIRDYEASMAGAADEARMQLAEVRQEHERCGPAIRL